MTFSTLARRLSLAALLGAMAFPAHAHQSGKALDETMFEREEYFQPMGEVGAPQFKLADADGRIVQSADFDGKIIVLNFVYASCTDVCPLHAEKIAEIQNKINASPMKDMVRFISVTTDPVKDDVEVMRGYAGWHGLDAANWQMLTRIPGAPEDATRSLAKEFGLRFTPSDDGEVQTHAAVTYIIDRQGRLAAKFHGLEFETTNAVLYINGLINVGQHTPGDDGWWARAKAVFD